MGKKDSLNNGEQLYSNAPLQNAELSASDKKSDAPAPDGKKKKDKKKSGKPNIFVRIGRFFKEMFSELKKVSWPDAKKVFTQLGVVLLVVVIFLIIISAFDFGAAELLRLLVSNAQQ